MYLETQSTSTHQSRGNAIMSNEWSDSELRAIWCDVGGKFHGPKVEHGTMPESVLLPFLRGLFEKSSRNHALTEQIATLQEKVRLKDVSIAIRNAECIDLEKENARLQAQVDSIQAVVNEQAEDEGLWHECEYLSEEYIQSALRRLHRVIEGEQVAAQVDRMPVLVGYVDDDTQEAMRHGSEYNNPVKTCRITKAPRDIYQHPIYIDPPGQGKE